MTDLVIVSASPELVIVSGDSGSTVEVTESTTRAPLSATPPLGLNTTPVAGVGVEASRYDHRHPFPIAANIPNTPAGTGAVVTDVQTKLRESVSVKDFGAVGDGVTDDRAAFQLAIDHVFNLGGGTVNYYGRHLIDSNLTVKDCVALVGPLGLPDEILPANASDYDGKVGVLIVNSSATIITNDSASVCCGIIIRKGLDLPFADATAATAGVAAFAGTALTVGGAGSYFHHLLILGFDRAIDSLNFERPRCEYVSGDCTNGIRFRTVFDIAYVENCHFWSFTTTHQSWTTNALITRSGIAYEYSTTGDWSKITNCFSYGYATGYKIDSCNNVNLIGCGADYPAALSATAVGFLVSGTSRQATLIGCQAAAQGTGYSFTATPAAGGGHRMIGCESWDMDVAHINLSAGRLSLTGHSLFGGSYGVTVNSASNGVYAVNNDFDTVTTPWTISAPALDQSTITLNRYFACSDTTVGDVRNFDNQRDLLILRAFNMSANGARYTFDKARGSAGSPSAAAGNDATINLRGRAWSGTQWGTNALIRAQLDSVVGATSTPGKIIFSTTSPAAVSETDRVLLTSAGSLQPVTDNAYALGDTGKLWSAVWSATGTIQTSDQRTKENIKPAVLGLDFINSLHPVSYTWKVGGNEVIRQVYRDAEGNECDPNLEGAVSAEIITKEIPGTRTHWGLIAQEVKQATDAVGVDFAGWVLTDSNDPESQQALRYDQFIAPLIKAVQELSAKVASLEAQLAAK